LYCMSQVLRAVQSICSSDLSPHATTHPRILNTVILQNTSRRYEMRGSLCPECGRVQHKIRHTVSHTAREFTCVNCKGRICNGDA